LKDSNVRPCHPLHHEDGWWLAGNTVPLSSNCETLLNFKKGREKETRGEDQSPSKQTTQKRQATRRQGNP
jgi:hypothetical protein